ncbi:ElyC/SanA/YdcF family protein [Enteractinococcus coprophilus]|uniref:DUF218 domain-containing protein n=1 Tax=Enteractinococcus coprophilus TaxID=1027633 RepID=A0A543AGG3_9MICC|nr:ElyC/SanA/YdcF family protein [Enteractinococcus coprophilus]TQL71660.1 DUF218 domain-containing protein [Enteractinococcus coprophilus]
MTTPRSDQATRIGTTKVALKHVSLAIITLIAVWFLFLSGGVVFPPQGETEGQSDAIVSLAPQEHRLYTATQLVENGHIDTLVISHFAGQIAKRETGESTRQISVTDYCQEHADNGVTCFTPSEDATIGEAFAVRELATQESWDNLTVVTTREHAFRAHYIFEQCVGDDVEVNLVHADANLSIGQWVSHIVYENAAFFKALWQTSTRC